MKVVCAWCQRDGNFVVLREKEPPGDEISHGICDEHILVFLAEARRSHAAPSVPARASVILDPVS